MDAKDAEIEQLKARVQQHETRLEQLQSQHAATIEQFMQTLESKDQQIAQLELRIKRLLLTVRGSRQERIDPSQLLLFSLEELQQLAQELEQEAAQPTSETTPEATVEESAPPQRKPTGRRRLPAHYPREVRRYELSEEQRACPCCGETRVEFAVEESEQLEHVPARWKVIQHQRVKYACRHCEEQVVVAPKPPQPIEKGVPGPGLSAHTVLSKFGDHQPLYREEDLFSRSGWMIRRSTICNWLFELALLADPLVMRMMYLVLQSKVIHTDDTKIKMLAPRICREAKFWPYLGDWLHRYVVYDFTLNRTRDGPLRFLKDYSGYLQADAYSGYDCIYAPGRVREVACWIHTRRYWHEAIGYDAARANTALGFIARLAQIESQLRHSYPERNLQGERDFALIAAARQKYARPVLDEFKQWLDGELESGRILPKSNLRAAFTYTLNQWTALGRYVDEGYLSMENNAAKRMVKYAALGRKNYLFVGNERAGRNAAIFYSMVNSAKLNGVEPQAWLTDVFTRLPYHRCGAAFAQASAGEAVTSEELDYLLPDRWLRDHPGNEWTIDAVRREERRQKEKRHPRRPPNR